MYDNYEIIIMKLYELAGDQIERKNGDKKFDLAG